MTHYVCQGECGGVSDKPGVCQAESCSMHQQPLVECNCENPQHLEKLSKKDSSKFEEE